jgi:hypothetical protein
MVSHLLNIDETLANKVAAALGLKTMPKPADAAMPTRQDLDPSSGDASQREDALKASRRMAMDGPRGLSSKRLHS